MIRPECEQHYTPARDNQYRATARYYKDSCPYCEIDRLKGELEEARADLHRAVSANSLYNQQASNLEHQLEEANNTVIAHANTISRVEAANVHLQDQLAKAKKEAQNYKNVLIGQGFENLDALAYETRDTTQIGAIAKQRTEQIIAQLAEARAEVERLTEGKANRATREHAELVEKVSRLKVEIKRLNTLLDEAHEELVISIKERINLGGQLAEAREEIERLKVIKWVQTESYEAVAAVEQARQDAAKWVADLLFSPEWEKECHCCEDYYCSICRIKDEFGLEG